ncbi:tetratricopeptide repeat protein [Actinoplanes aureus]|uniref:Tetratricopeptide repeat protein n=1 Tax=Actinoplanes aureus TaxID=2792083 RepID=A0A931CKK5_9ACTN|nr:tetratricopeptide repeat protein [Actinoplanes aureus]MBG0564896.1 hypothetical protein [Actinoplanes aureus]MBG0569093.1 hypothetical protein [Actinoplanes aureus]
MRSKPPWAGLSVFLIAVGTVAGDLVVNAAAGSLGDLTKHRTVLLAAATGVAVLAGLVALRQWRGDEPADQEPAGTGAAGMVSLVPPADLAEQRVRGRDAVIAELTRIFSLRGRRAPRVRVLSGLGGSGKTAVAGVVAHRLRRRGVDVWWVSGATATGLQAGMRALAYALGATEGDVNRAWSTSGDAPGLLWRLLEARSRRWLLVIDNADDVDALAAEGETVAAARGWLRPVPSGRGAILVTSRDGDPSSWARWCQIRPIGVLNSQDGARVLRDQAGDPAGSWDDAVALAERLGGLPLALRLAGGYLASTNRVPLPGAITTYAAYRDAYGRGGVTAVFGMPDAALTDERARGVIGRTWELSLDLLAGRGLGAGRPLLRLLAGLADAPIPYERVLDAAVLAGSEPFAGLDEARLRELLQALAGLSLIDLETRGTPPARRPLTVRLHPLVRDTARTPDSLGLAVELVGRAASDEIAGRPEDPAGWPLWQLLDPHLTHLSGAAAGAPIEVFLNAASGALRAVRHLNISGLYPAAEQTGREVAKACAQRLGADHPATLRARAQLAAVLGASGRPEAARTELSGLLSLFVRSLGETHPDTLEVRGSLARWTGESGDTAAARDQLAALVPLYAERFGEEHIETLRVRANLASAAGDEWAMRDQFADLIPVYERVCVPTHPDTLRARANLVEAGGARLDARGPSPKSLSCTRRFTAPSTPRRCARTRRGRGGSRSPANLHEPPDVLLGFSADRGAEAGVDIVLAVDVLLVQQAAASHRRHQIFEQVRGRPSRVEQCHPQRSTLGVLIVVVRLVGSVKVSLNQYIIEVRDDSFGDQHGVSDHFNDHPVHRVTELDEAQNLDGTIERQSLEIISSGQHPCRIDLGHGRDDVHRRLQPVRGRHARGRRVERCQQPLPSQRILQQGGVRGGHMQWTRASAAQHHGLHRSPRQVATLGHLHGLDLGLNVGEHRIALLLVADRV